MIGYEGEKNLGVFAKLYKERTDVVVILTTWYITLPAAASVSLVAHLQRSRHQS